MSVQNLLIPSRPRYAPPSTRVAPEYHSISGSASEISVEVAPVPCRDTLMEQLDVFLRHHLLRNSGGVEGPIVVAIHVDRGNKPTVDRVDGRTWKFHLNPTLLSAPPHHVRDYDVLTGVDELERLDAEVIPDGIDLPEEAPVAVVSLVDVGVEELDQTCRPVPPGRDD